MKKGGTVGKRRGVIIAVVVTVVLVLGLLIHGSTTLVQAECELCVDFRGQSQCRKGSGVDEPAARDAAIRAACAVMASGMDESIACNNTRPRDVRCTAR